MCSNFKDPVKFLNLLSFVELKMHHSFKISTGARRLGVVSGVVFFFLKPEEG